MGLLLTGCAGTDGEQTEDGQGPGASATQDGASGSGGTGEGGTGATASISGQASEAADQAEASASVDPADFPASNTTELTHLETIEDPGLSSKSVVSNQHGLMITNTMMYRHNVMLFDTRTREVVQTLEDTVDTDAMGIDGLSVVDTGSGEIEHTVPLDTMPRGSVVLPDNKTAYVVAMWADKLFRVDLETGTAELVMRTDPQPRHLTLSPDGKTLCMTVAGADEIVKLDAATGEVLDTAPAGVNTIGVTYDDPTGQV